MTEPDIAEPDVPDIDLGIVPLSSVAVVKLTEPRECRAGTLGASSGWNWGWS